MSAVEPKVMHRPAATAKIQSGCGPIGLPDCASDRRGGGGTFHHDVARSHSKTRLKTWHIWGRCFEGLLRIKRGDLVSGLQAFRTALHKLARDKFKVRYSGFLGDLVEALLQAGEAAEGLAAVDEALVISKQCEAR
jgi:hypothetical protein